MAGSSQLRPEADRMHPPRPHPRTHQQKAARRSAAVNCRGVKIAQIYLKVARSVCDESWIRRSFLISKKPPCFYWCENDTRVRRETLRRVSWISRLRQTFEHQRMLPWSRTLKQLWNTISLQSRSSQAVTINRGNAKWHGEIKQFDPLFWWSVIGVYPAGIEPGPLLASQCNKPFKSTGEARFRELRLIISTIFQMMVSTIPPDTYIARSALEPPRCLSFDHAESRHKMINERCSEGSSFLSREQYWFSSDLFYVALSPGLQVKTVNAGNFAQYVDQTHPSRLPDWHPWRWEA